MSTSSIAAPIFAKSASADLLCANSGEAKTPDGAHSARTIFLRCALLLPPGRKADIRFAIANGYWGEDASDSSEKFIAIPENGEESRRLELDIHTAKGAPPVLRPRVSINMGNVGFSFFPHDVSIENPIWIPRYEVVVTEAGDRRDYRGAVEAIRSKGFRTDLAEIEAEPEESFAAAARRNRNQTAPIWLALGRDMRMFRLQHQASQGFSGAIEPCFHSKNWGIPETKGQPYFLNFAIGQGIFCEADVTRRLEDGSLPMLHLTQRDGDMVYHLRAFATLETQELKPGCVRGTDWLPALYNTNFHMLSEEEIERSRSMIEKEMTGREEEVICCVRIEAVNCGRTPRHAWFKAARIRETEYRETENQTFDGAEGFSQFDGGRVYGIHRLDGKPMPQPEVAVLIPPEGRVVWDMLLPHQPVSRSRARALAGQNVEAHWEACRNFWKDKLAGSAKIELPEKGIAERIKAGLLHCDISTLGRESEGPLLATPGSYAPIGSESAPIILYYDSMGWHDVARRSLMFFLQRQREDGFLQNFNNYQLETGPVLWTVAEHYRHTRDESWIRSIADCLIKACDFLIRWRHESDVGGEAGKSRGLQAGKVADPDDYFQSYALNAHSYLGLKRTAEILEEVGLKEEALRLQKEAAAYREDIRSSFRAALRRGPVIPLGDGSWTPTAGPWAESSGPLSLYAEGGEWFSHGGFGTRDALLGPLYLVFCEIFDAEEPEAEFALQYHQRLFTRHNAGLSQPYYCRQDWAHLKRGEVKAFLKLYYNQITAIQDRQNYTFLEHYYDVSFHKTHEEAWFLLQTRWMLCHEEKNELHLLSAIPRKWLKPGDNIQVENLSTHFGPLTLRVEVNSHGDQIKAEVCCPINRGLQAVHLRIPHPEEKRALRVIGGVYDPAAETVVITPFEGTAAVVCEFSQDRKS